jgi:hypothetical protein
MVKLESGDYEPRDSDSVVCEKHGVRTRGNLYWEL